MIEPPECCSWQQRSMKSGSKTMGCVKLRPIIDVDAQEMQRAPRRLLNENACSD